MVQNVTDIHRLRDALHMSQQVFTDECCETCDALVLLRR